MKNLKTFRKVQKILKKIEDAIEQHGANYFGEVNIGTFRNTLSVIVRTSSVDDFVKIFEGDKYTYTDNGNGNTKFMITL